MADSFLPVVSQYLPTDSPIAGEMGVHTERHDADETDKKKLTGKEPSKGMKQNFVPLTKTSPNKKKKKPGEQSEEVQEEESANQSDKKVDGSGCTKSRKLDKKKCDSLTPGRLDACWKGYKKVGMKTKGGKQVPDCVPASGGKKRIDLKCGKGAISKGQKCTKGPATAAKSGLGSRYGGGVGGVAKAIGLGGLEAVKWTSGYNIGKQAASATSSWKGGANEAKKKSGFEKTATIIGTTSLLGLASGLGAARRYGLFGETDLENNKRNYKRGDYKKLDSVWASGFSFDGTGMYMGSKNLATIDTPRAKKKKGSKAQPKNKSMAGIRNA